MPHYPRKSRAFTMVEMAIVMVILAIVAGMAMPAISDSEASQRANYAAREFIAALRYARTQAMATGRAWGVQTDTTNRLFLVFDPGPPLVSPVSHPMGAGGLYSVSLLTSKEIRGVIMTPNLPAVSGISQIPYNALGTCTHTSITTNTPGKVTFKYGPHNSIVIIPPVGDPYIQ